MTITQSCPLCQNKQGTLAYTANNIPIFQNKVYSSRELALTALTSNVKLVICDKCNFVFNSVFDPVDMHYDGQYENEQAHSNYFQDHLNSIITLFNKNLFRDKKVIEIGCGKGFFLEKLNQSGFNVTGFDPAYTGDNPNIIKDYFNSNYSNLSAEVIVLRHVLEHIQQPLDFLHRIAEAVDYSAKIYIEVPSLEWILENKAFWDIFYEHCNYFTFESLGGMFKKSEQGSLFNQQYMYLIADLKDLKTQNDSVTSNTKLLNKFLNFENTIHHYKENLNTKTDLIVWGAGAKGVTFTNLIDPNKNLISHLIDINPKKQHQFIAKTTHQILPPEMLKDHSVKHILVMNDNYFDEIEKFVSPFNLNVMKLNAL